MIDKTISLTAAADLLQDGQTLALGGMTLYRRPVAFVLAVTRRPNPPRRLTLLNFAAGIESDILVGKGLISRSRACYFGLESFGLAPQFTAAANAGEIEIVEESEASIAWGLRAKISGVGFMPSLAWQGTDMLAVRPDVQTITDPYTGQPLTAFPAIGCDLAVIHVLKADRFGNAILGGNPTIDLELALAAGQVVLTTEELADQLDGPIDLAGHPVTAVVHAPYGAWPTSCYPRYPLDGETILEYIAACSEGRFDAFIKEFNASADAPYWR